MNCNFRKIMEQHQQYAFLIHVFGFYDHSNIMYGGTTTVCPVFHLIRTDNEITGAEQCGNLFQRILIVCREFHNHAPQAYTFKEIIQNFHTNKEKYSGGYSYSVHTGTDGKPDSRCSPYSCGSSQTTYNLLLQQYYSTCTYKTYSTHYLSSKTARVESHKISFKHIGKAILRDNHQQRTSQGYKKMSSISSLL